MSGAEGRANAMWTWVIGNAVAATWTVGPNEPLTSVQDAIVLASSGDEIVVQPGRYEEALDLLGKELTLRATAGPTATVLAPPALQTAVRYDEGESGSLEGFTLLLDGGRGVEVVGGSPELRGLVIETPGHAGANGGGVRIRGGRARIEDVTVVDALGGQGGAFWIGENAEVELVTVHIANPQASFGGALYVTEAVVDAVDLVIDTPWSDYAGGGVYADAATVRVTSLSITDARGDLTAGVGVHLRDGAALEVDGGTIHGCHAASRQLGYDGGGLYVDPTSSVSLSGVTLAHNEAARGGGIATDGGDVTLFGVTFDSNRALEEGGALAASSSARLEIVAGRFSDNRAGSGGALHLRTLARLADTGSIYVANEATADGGAVFADGARAVDLSDATFQSNRATESGGALHVEGVTEGLVLQDGRFDSNRATNGDGGAVHVGTDTPVDVAGTTFVSNRAVSGDGGGVAVDPALAGSAADVQLIGARFDANQANGDGGGAWLHSVDEVVVTETTFLRNAASSRGGGLALNGARQVSVVRSTWHENTADQGGGVHEYGSVQPSSIRSCTFSENSARTGAGLTLRATATAEVVNNTFVGNGASSAGAHLHITQGTVRLVNTIAAWGTDGGGIYGDLTASGLSDRFYHLTWENAGGDWVGQFTTPAPSSQSLAADPQFVAYTLDGNLADDDLRLLAGSPAVDAGDPGLVDVDGSRSDLGAWGGPSGFVIDRDGDGSYAHVDCDDNDPRRSPEQVELPYDGLDQDCDGFDLADVDTDGYDGGPNGTDCDDTDPAVHPEAIDPPYDGVDGDCAGDSDFDVDGDGHDSDVYGGRDCNDTDPAIRPDGVEVYYDGVDSDCDGRSDFDRDHDGRDALAHGGDDCHDGDPSIFFGAPERCDERDNDCNGLVDDDPIDPLTFYVDADGDGYGDANRWELHCRIRTGLADNGDDCDDGEATVHPGATERWYDGVDDDCDGRDDDQDGDGHPIAEDCDDTDPEAHPSAPERLNGRDDDCDGFAETADRDDDGLIDAVEWSLGTDPEDADSDGDGATDGEESPDGEGVDTDQDGGIDALDPDDDDDRIPTRRERSVDVDGDGNVDLDVDQDGLPNHLDTDADADGRPDVEEGVDDLDGDGIPDFADAQGPYAGGGCAMAPHAASWLVGLVVLGLRRRSPWLLGGLVTSAHAQTTGLDAHNFEVYDPTNDARSGLRVGEGGRLRRGLMAAAVVDGASAPLVERLPDGDEGLLTGLLTANAVLSGAPWPRLRIDVAMPLHVFGVGPTGGFVAPGDLRLGVAAVVMPQRDRRLGVSVLVNGWVPTGAAGRFVGLPRPALAPVVALAQRLGRFGWSVNLGARVAATVPVRDVDVGPGALVGAGAHVVLAPQWILRAEAISDSSTGFGDWPVELSLGAAWQRPRGQVWSADVSVGLGAVPGVPSWRMALGFAVGPPIELPEILVHEPLDPEPEPEPLPQLIEVHIVREDPPPPPVFAAVEDDRIVVSEQVFFQEGRADLLERSVPVLRAVLGVLRQHPDIDYLLIEGHTNHHGSGPYNLWLSRARADEVARWLMNHGVPRSRLITEGYGFERPLVAQHTPDAAEVNRRVEFVLVRSEEREVAPALPEGPHDAVDERLVGEVGEPGIDEEDGAAFVVERTPEGVSDDDVPVPVRAEEAAETDAEAAPPPPTFRDQRFPSPAESWLRP